ncbi:Trypsin [Popillia japonica]|uniref:Trypsin n=1 Tax=Popillia japonica TaxID=7064 RepID=A0AAW1JCY8_POPJA
MNRLIYLVVLVSVTYAEIGEDEEDAIINGNLAEIEDFPYYAFIARNGRLHCGGVFIEKDLVLTAAHCLKHQEITVYAGITKLSNLRKAKVYEAKYIRPHHKYFVNRDAADDIGLIRLKEKIKLGKKAQLISLPTEAPPIGEAGTVVGFGIVKCKGSIQCYQYSRSSKHLRYADLVFESIEKRGVLRTRSDDKKNTCYGDSGGPIVYNGTVVGLVSSGEFGDCTGYDTQAPVAANLDWIRETSSLM